MSTATTTPQYLTLQDAGALGFGANSTLRAKIASGLLPAVKIGGRLKVRRDDLEALVVPKAIPADPDAVADAIARAVAAAPPLGPERVERLAALLARAA